MAFLDDADVADLASEQKGHVTREITGAAEDLFPSDSPAAMSPLLSPEARPEAAPLPAFSQQVLPPGAFTAPLPPRPTSPAAQAFAQDSADAARGLAHLSERARRCLPPPVLAAFASPTFPELGGALARAAARCPLFAQGNRNPAPLAAWAKNAREHLEKVAEATSTCAACAFASDLGSSLVALHGRSRPELGRVRLAELADSLGVRQDVAALARDALMGFSSVGAPQVAIPGTPATPPALVPGKPGPTFDYASGVPLKGAQAPFPARKIAASAKRGDPNARAFIAHAAGAALAGEPGALPTALALKSAVKLDARDAFTTHYLTLGRGLRRTGQHVAGLSFVYDLGELS